MLQITAVSAQTQSEPVDLPVSADHTISAYAASKLLWDTAPYHQVVVNLTMSEYRVNTSEINVISISFATVGSSGTEDFKTNTTEMTMTTTNQTVEYVQQVATPKLSDRFYLNITITASPSGGGVSTDPVRVSFRFPKSDTIVVQRDELVPLVNLYGFPQSSFFVLWGPIYLIFIFFLLTPTIVFGFSKLRELRDRTPEEEDATTDNTEMVPPDADSEPQKEEVNNE